MEVSDIVFAYSQVTHSLGLGCVVHRKGGERSARTLSASGQLCMMLREQVNGWRCEKAWPLRGPDDGISQKKRRSLWDKQLLQWTRFQQIIVQEDNNLRTVSLS